MVEEDKEITGVHGWDLSCNLTPKIEALDSSGEGFRMYSRTKRRKKMTNSGHITKTGFNDEVLKLFFFF